MLRNDNVYDLLSLNVLGFLLVGFLALQVVKAATPLRLTLTWIILTTRDRLQFALISRLWERSHAQVSSHRTRDCYGCFLENFWAELRSIYQQSIGNLVGDDGTRHFYHSTHNNRPSRTDWTQRSVVLLHGDLWHCIQSRDQISKRPNGLWWICTRWTSCLVLNLVWAC